MNVLWQTGHGAMQVIYQGFARALNSLGHSVNFWSVEHKPAFDVFTEKKYDLFVGATYNLNRATIKCLSMCPQTKIALRGSNNGELNDQIDLQKYPVLVANDNEKKLVERLIEVTGQQIPIFSHYPDSYIEATMGKWRDVGGLPLGLMNACDVHHVCGGKFREDIKTDLLFVGGSWGYKSRNLSKYIHQFCHPIGKYRIKIFGGGWGVPQCLGLLPDQDLKDAFASTTIGLSVHEPHSTDEPWSGWDVVDRPFKLAGAGTFVVGDYVKGLREIYTEDEMVLASSPQDMLDKVDYFLSNPEARLPYIKSAQEKTLRDHTYENRVEKLFEVLKID